MQAQFIEIHQVFAKK